MNWITALFSYLEPIAPDYPSKVEAASEHDIERLQTVMRINLPNVYLEYLRAMGRYDGGLFDDARERTDIASVLRLIIGIKDEDPTVDFKTFIPFALGDVEEGWSLVPKGTEFAVAVIENNRPDREIAPSLPHLVFSAAFGLRFAASAHEVTFRVRADGLTLDKLAQQATELGFAREWFCDDTHYFGNSDDTLIEIHPGLVRGFDGFVAAKDLPIAQAFAEALAKRFGGSLVSQR